MPSLNTIKIPKTVDKILVHQMKLKGRLGLGELEMRMFDVKKGTYDIYDIEESLIIVPKGQSPVRKVWEKIGSFESIKGFYGIHNGTFLDIINKPLNKAVDTFENFNYVNFIIKKMRSLKLEEEGLLTLGLGIRYLGVWFSEMTDSEHFAHFTKQLSAFSEHELCSISLALKSPPKKHSTKHSAKQTLSIYKSGENSYMILSESLRKEMKREI